MAVLVLVGALSGWWIVHQSGGPAPVSTPLRPAGAAPVTSGPEAGVAQPGPVTNLAVQAEVLPDRTSADSQDAAGTAVSYRWANLTDGSLRTAWRMDGDGTGSSITFTFAEPVTLTEVALTNGYTKRDPRDDADRYLEERRITEVTWKTDQGTSYRQTLADPDRGLQRLPIRATSVSSLTLTIDATTEPGEPDRDYTAISEVEITGGPG